MELEAGGTGYSLAGSKKFPLEWEDPIFNRDTGLEDKTGYNYCYVIFTKTGKTEKLFFDPEMKEDGLFTTTIGDDGMPILMLVGIKK